MTGCGVRNMILPGLLLALLSPVTGLAAQAAPVQAIGTAMAMAPLAGPAAYAYGAASLQRLDFWRAAPGKPAPLILFVQGGGWKRGDKQTATGRQKVEHLVSQGYAFASIDYRLVPAATVKQQAAHVAGRRAQRAGVFDYSYRSRRRQGPVRSAGRGAAQGRDPGAGAWGCGPGPARPYGPEQLAWQCRCAGHVAG